MQIRPRKHYKTNKESPKIKHTHSCFDFLQYIIIITIIEKLNVAEFVELVSKVLSSPHINEKIILLRFLEHASESLIMLRN